MEWDKGMDLYKIMVRKRKKAKEEGVIKEVLCFQGESDTLAKKDVVLYMGGWSDWSRI